jgi:hypothetical protein
LPWGLWLSEANQEDKYNLIQIQAHGGPQVSRPVPFRRGAGEERLL